MAKRCNVTKCDSCKVGQLANSRLCRYDGRKRAKPLTRSLLTQVTTAKNRRNLSQQPQPQQPQPQQPQATPAAPAAPAGTDGLTAQAQAQDAQAQAQDAQAQDAQAQDAQAQALGTDPNLDPMELARQRRAERIAEARAAKAAAAKVMDSLIESVKAEPITKKPEWNIDLALACAEAPEPIRLQDSFKGSHLDKEAKTRYFFRTPEILRLNLSIEQNLAGVKITGETKKQRNDPMLKLVRNWIAANVTDLKGDGAELLSLIDDFTLEEPIRQATLGWASSLVGPQSILGQIALQSGRYALLNPVTGKVKLVRDFYAKAKS